MKPLNHFTVLPKCRFHYILAMTEQVFKCQWFFFSNAHGLFLNPEMSLHLNYSNEQI